MAQKKNLDSGLTPPETKTPTPPEEKVTKVKDLKNLHEKVDAAIDGITAILKHLGEATVAADLEARRGKFGTQVPPKENIPNRNRPGAADVTNGGM